MAPAHAIEHIEQRCQAAARLRSADRSIAMPGPSAALEMRAFLLPDDCRSTRYEARPPRRAPPSHASRARLLARAASPRYTSSRSSCRYGLGTAASFVSRPCRRPRAILPGEAIAGERLNAVNPMPWSAQNGNSSRSRRESSRLYDSAPLERHTADVAQRKRTTTARRAATPRCCCADVDHLSRAHGFVEPRNSPRSCLLGSGS